MSNSPAVSVVIRTYDRPKYLASCLRSLERQTESPIEVIIVEAEVAKQLWQTIGGIRLIHVRQKGRGVSNAANEGISRASGDVVAFIDDDAFASPRWIEALRRSYVVEPSIAGVGGTVLDYRTNEVSFDRGVMDIFGVPHMRARQPRSPYPAFPFLSGCNMSFRRAVLRELDGFDEFYKYSHEEPDLCVRLQRAGYKIAFEPNAIVWHHHAPGPARRHIAYNTERSRVYFSLSNFGLPIGQLAMQTVVNLPRLTGGLALAAIRRGKTPAFLFLPAYLLVEALIGAVVGALYGTRHKMHHPQKRSKVAA